MRALDRAHAFLFLQILDASAEFFHLGPVNLWDGNDARRDSRCRKTASYKFFRSCSRPTQSACPDSRRNAGSIRSSN